MSTDTRGCCEGHKPIATAEDLNAALTTLGVSKGDGPDMPYGPALGALLYVVEMINMFDVSAENIEGVRAGYLSMALMTGVTISGEEQPAAGSVTRGSDFSDEAWSRASFTMGRLIESRLSRTLEDLEGMVAEVAPGEFSLAWPVRSLMRSIVELLPYVNADEYDESMLLKSAKASREHLVKAQEHLNDLVQLAAR